MNVKVTKFGGSSLADAGQFRKVKDIILSDPARCYVVPSAPGKRFSGDEKVTDMLYACHALAQQGRDIEPVFSRVRERYLGIAADLGVNLDLAGELAEVARNLAAGASADYAASRGEYLNGRILAAYLGYDFVDPAGLILFDEEGYLDGERTQQELSYELKRHRRAVVPGFYGSYADGRVKTFSRGGSDISGAIVARAVDAFLYENWTDVSGFMMADPHIVDDPHIIRRLTYHELRELAYMGAGVLHDESIFPVRKAGIPINIRNTNDPAAPGTMIVSQYASDDEDPSHITGVAGRKGFVSITVEKNLMNSERGFGRRILQVLEESGVNFEHLPSGIDTISMVVSERELGGHLDTILERIRQRVQPDTILVEQDLALIATVGRRMIRRPGMAYRVFGALAKANVNVRMIDQGSSELNIIVGVDNRDFETAIRAIYDAFEGEDRERFNFLYKQTAAGKRG